MDGSAMCSESKPKDAADPRERLPEIVEGLVASGRNLDDMNHITARELPRKSVVVGFLDDLMDITYPGYFASQNVSETNLRFYVGNKVDGMFGRLSELIAKSLRHECKKQSEPCDLCRHRGMTESARFFEVWPSIREILHEDMWAAYEGDPAAKSLDEIIFSYPCTFAITVYRAAHQLHSQQIPLIPRMMTEHAHSVTGIDIHPGATIGRAFFIDHGTGVVIGETCEIGDNVKIYQGVTLGAKSFPRDSKGNIIRDQKRHPTLEDDVVVYSGTTILGDVTIGRGTSVGGNVWLTQSVPAGVRIIAETPALKMKNATEIHRPVQTDRKSEK
ncbi:MAG: serine acetyltransferase [Candidatus Hydrogenedentes bacterium]|nr:serine acetyltransferase [Candidatus Hydrogenedentota bacterium]